MDETTIAELRASMASGSLTSRALTETYLARIETIDPALRSVLQTNPDAIETADALDAERRSGRVRGPLHGIPVLVKDNIDSADRMRTTAGSFALGDVTPAHDAAVVARLREAGAVILGKSNLSEWANFRSTRSSSGWSARGGQCVNPYDVDRSPCGSSSGSGVAVSANLCAVAVGTETDGSIICPSSINGLVGIKPTVGLVSRSGVIPISHSQDTPGPMARTVADAAALLTALAGADERDAATTGAHVEADYAAFVDPDGLRGARIGVARNLAGFNDRVDRLFEDALAAMRDLGAEIVDPADIPHVDELEDPELEVLLFEFRADLESYLGSLGPAQQHRTLADLIAFNAEHADAEMPFFGQELFEQAAAKGPLTEPAYLEALETCRRLSRAEGIDAVMDRASPGRARRAVERARVADRPRQRRPRCRRQLDAGGGGGLPQRHRPDGVRVRPPDRDLVPGPCLERGAADPAGVGVRARDAPPAAAGGGGVVGAGGLEPPTARL